MDQEPHLYREQTTAFLLLR